VDVISYDPTGCPRQASARDTHRPRDRGQSLCWGSSAKARGRFGATPQPGAFKEPRGAKKNILGCAYRGVASDR
jgi:hypothetical protein